MLNQLKLALIPFSYSSYDDEGNPKETHTTKIGEFFIDEKSLAKWLGIQRDLGNCDTDIDSTPAIKQHFLNGLKGEIPPFNQFVTNTFALYRCHCGCDYCGVISAEIIVNATQVIWKNVGYESDFDVDENKLDNSEKWQLTRLNFTFDKAEYFAEIQRFNQSINV